MFFFQLILSTLATTGVFIYCSQLNSKNSVRTALLMLVVAYSSSLEYAEVSIYRSHVYFILSLLCYLNTDFAF